LFRAADHELVKPTAKSSVGHGVTVSPYARSGDAQLAIPANRRERVAQREVRARTRLKIHSYPVTLVEQAGHGLPAEARR